MNTNKPQTLLHSDQQILLDFAALVEQMFKGEAVFHVGSSFRANKAEGYRDIDLRVIMEPRKFARLRRIVDVDRLNLAVSVWGQKITGLPIDFQVQNRTYVNKRHSGYRNNIGGGHIAIGDGYDPKTKDTP